MLGVDISNYTSDLTPAALEAWKQQGYSLVIVQAIAPPAGYPAGKTRQQIQQCHDASLAVDAYTYLWFDADVSDIQRKLALLEGMPIRRLWLDVEDTAAVKYDQATCEQKVAEALAACDLWGEANALRTQTGVYTGRWFWADQRYMANTTTFSDRALWDANYDNVADAAQGFTPYGGWTRCAIKQYRGTSSLAGISGVDLNVLSDTEAQAVTDWLNGGNDTVKIPADYVQKFGLPNDQDVQGLIDHFEGVVRTVREIAFAQGQAAGADAESRLARIRDVVNA